MLVGIHWEMQMGIAWFDLKRMPLTVEKLFCVVRDSRLFVPPVRSSASQVAVASNLSLGRELS